MNQNAAALEHYWHLRTQGVGPTAARFHVARRFGIDIPVFVTERASEACREVPAAQPSTDFGTEFAQTLWGTGTGPVDGLRAGKNAHV